MRKLLPLLFFVTIIISACGPVTPAPAPTESVQRIANPKSTVPTFEMAHYPNLAQIKPENINLLQQIDRLATGPILAVATSPDKTRIAVAIPGQISIYDTATLIQQKTIPATERQDRAPALVFSPDGQTLVFSSSKADSNYYISFWDLISGKLKRQFASQVPKWPINSIELSPDGERLIVYTKGFSLRCDGGDANLALYDRDGVLLIDRYFCSESPSEQYGFTTNNEQYGFTTDGKAYFFIIAEAPIHADLLDAKTGALIESYTRQVGKEASIDQRVLYNISHDGNILAYAVFKNQSESITTELVDFRTKEIVYTATGLLEFFVENGKINWRPVVNVANSPITPKLVLEACNVINQLGPNYYTLVTSNSKKAVLTISHSFTIDRLELWNLATCKVENTISSPYASYASIFSPNGRWLATSDNYSAYVWNTETRKIQFSVPGEMFDHHRDIIQFNADGRRFLTSSRYYKGQASHTYTISSFDTQTGKLVREITPIDGMLDEIVPTPDKDIILVVDSTGFHFWNIETGQLLSDLPSGPYTFDLNSGQIWVSIKKDEDLHQIVLFDYLTGHQVRELAPIHARVIRKLSITDTQKLIVHFFLNQTKDGDEIISSIDLQSEATVYSAKISPQDAYSVASQNIFATYGGQGYINLWDFKHDFPYLVLLGNYKNRTVDDDYILDPYNYVTVQFFDEQILFAKGDTIRFWDTKTGKLLTEIKPNYEIASITFNPNQQLMAVTGKDGGIRLWGVRKP